jgi:hypothetical protein
LNEINVDQVFDFEQLEQAPEYYESGKSMGKCIVRTNAGRTADEATPTRLSTRTTSSKSSFSGACSKLKLESLIQSAGSSIEKFLLD